MVEMNAEGWMTNPEEWTTDAMHELASFDNLVLTEEMISYIMSAREFYDEYQTVPPIREFAKMHGMDRKAERLYELFPRGPMKMIARFGGLPAPTGCV